MLSEARRKRMLDAQTSTAQKVYGIVPHEDVWTQQQCASELVRIGAAIDFKILLGCLDTLVRAGLIREVGRGRFVREQVRKRAPEAAKPIALETEGEIILNADVKTEVKKMPPIEAIDQLANIAAQMKIAGNSLLALSRQLDDVALDIEAKAAKGGEDIQQLRLLRETLKGLVG